MKSGSRRSTEITPITIGTMEAHLAEIGTEGRHPASSSRTNFLA
jgi:hypothetical protein